MYGGECVHLALLLAQRRRYSACVCAYMHKILLERNEKMERTIKMLLSDPKNIGEEKERGKASSLVVFLSSTRK